MVSFLDETDLSTTDEINSEVSFIESSRYTIELYPDGDELKNVSSLLVFLNEDLEIGRWEKGVAESFILKESHCTFIGQIDLLQFSIDIEYEDGTYARKLTEHYLCVFKEEDDFKNIEHIIENILNFDDEHIVAHMFSLTRRNASSNAALLRGSFLQKSHKTLRTIIKHIKEICACYRIYLPFFQRKAHHRVITERSVLPIEAVRNISESSVYWLAQTPEALSKSHKSNAVAYALPNNYVPIMLESYIEKRSFDVYENQICCAFITKVLNFILKLESKLSESRKTTEEFLRRYTKIEKLKAPVLVLKHQLLEAQKPLCEQILHLKGELFGLKKQYDKILKCKYSELSALPKATKVFLNNPVYHAFFKHILAWYKDGEFEQAGDDSIFKARTATELFEIFCLQQLLFKFKRHGFHIEITETPVFQYPSVPSAPLSKKSHIVANTYKLSKDGIQVSLYYEPRVYSYLPEGEHGNTMPNGLELYRIDSPQKKNYREPDFVLKIQDEQTSSYVILDAKYAFSHRIKPTYSNTLKHYTGHLASIIEKYYTYTSAFNHAQIRMVWTLQGRIDDSCRFERFGAASDIHPDFIPSVSFGNCPINTDKSKDRLSLLWNEICSMIPCMKQFIDTPSADSEEITLAESGEASQLSSQDSSIPVHNTESDNSVINEPSPFPIENRTVEFSQEKKRTVCKEFWNSCIQYINGSELIKARFRPLPPSTFGSSYTLHNYKKVGAKILLHADCESGCVSVRFSLPNIHKGEQRELFLKIRRGKEAITEELKCAGDRYVKKQLLWQEENNLLSIAVVVGFEYDNPTVISSLTECAYTMKGCIDRFR